MALVNRLNIGAPIPNLFIVGACKCGTTALSEYLRGHPDVFIARQKELHFFCSDFDDRYPRVRTETEYLGHFKAVSSECVIGEASPWYLYSSEAIKAAYAFNPEARFIAMVRNPLEMLPSLHRQLLNNFDENRVDLAEAWASQAARKDGKHIPESCREPRVLQYLAVCSLGAQIQRMFATIPAPQRMVVLHDDLRQDAATVYRRVLDFLRIDDDGRSTFPAINSAFRWRHQGFSRFVYSPPHSIRAIGKIALRLVGRERIGLFRTLDRLNERFNRQPHPNGLLPRQFVEELRNVFAEDVELLGQLLDRDLSRWVQ